MKKLGGKHLRKRSCFCIIPLTHNFYILYMIFQFYARGILKFHSEIRENKDQETKELEAEAQELEKKWSGFRSSTQFTTHNLH